MSGTVSMSPLGSIEPTNFQRGHFGTIMFGRIHFKEVLDKFQIWKGHKVS